MLVVGVSINAEHACIPGVDAHPQNPCRPFAGVVNHALMLCGQECSSVASGTHGHILLLIHASGALEMHRQRLNSKTSSLEHEMWVIPLHGWHSSPVLRPLVSDSVS